MSGRRLHVLSHAGTSRLPPPASQHASSPVAAAPPIYPQSEELHGRLSRQANKLTEAIAAAKAREAEAVHQLKAAEGKLREAVQRDDR